MRYKKTVCYLPHNTKNLTTNSFCFDQPTAVFGSLLKDEALPSNWGLVPDTELQQLSNDGSIPGGLSWRDFIIVSVCLDSDGVAAQSTLMISLDDGDHFGKEV